MSLLHHHPICLSNRYLSTILIITCLLWGSILSACQVSTPPVLTRPWNYTDLRILDAVDVNDPGQDILAAYVRTIDQNLQLRVDFLDLDDRPNYDLWIALDTEPGSAAHLPTSIEPDIQWDILITIPANGAVVISGWDVTTQTSYRLKNSGLWVMRDPQQDYLLVNIQRTALAQLSRHTAIQAWTVLPGTKEIIDRIEPFTLDSTPPPIAPTLVAFWNCLPAYTPAQALRRWDGAHTGPLGGRHGLANLLRAARNHQIPLMLLDLNTPTALSALDYLDGINLLHEVDQAGQLTLPTALPALGMENVAGGLPILPGWAIERLVVENKQVSKAFNLNPRGFLYVPYTLAELLTQTGYSLPAEAQIIITHQSATPNNASPARLPTASWLRWQNRHVLALPSVDQLMDPYDNATQDSLSISTRHALITHAIYTRVSQEPTQVLVLGGDLAHSAWGNPQIARAAFNYINQHPWMRIIGRNELQTLPANYPVVLPENHVTQTEPPAMAQYQQVARGTLNPIQQAAWHTLLALYAPAPPASNANLSQLRALYLAQTNKLLQVMDWVNHPVAYQRCDPNNEQGAAADCILASHGFLALVNSQNAVLQYAFARAQNGTVHQVIAPSYQLISGSSDWRTWELSNPLTADPQVIPGMMIQPESPVMHQFKADQLVFQYSDHSQLAYRLFEAGISVEKTGGINNRQSLTRIPLILDPWLRFMPGWKQQYSLSPIQDGWVWSFDKVASILIQSSQPITMQTLIESQAALSLPEDPNLEAPASHYLPLPLALAEIQTSGNYVIQIKVITP